MSGKVLDGVVAVLQDELPGVGVTVAEIRRRYPARSVRRAALVEALHRLEGVGSIRWHRDHVHWVGPLRAGSRPLGVPAERVIDVAASSPPERVRRMARLSRQLAARHG
jgi:hypothetical protein